jgi:hypothetical protein
MARDLLRIWLDLERIHCYDEGDGWGSAEPYLWTVFFKIDGESVALTDALTLAGSATVVGTPGSHGNLGDTDVDAGDNIDIPSALGEWSAFLSPIPVPASLQAFVGEDLPGVAGVVCVLMEEDNVTDDGAEAGHNALNAAVQGAIDDIIATRSFANQEITQNEIDQYLDAVASAVEDAVKSQQGFFEDIWSWLNKDDTIGSRVFFWTHDELADGATIDFSQQWGDDGDWEIFGHINATVACSAEAAAAASAIIDAVFSRVAGDMRSFRDRDFGSTQLPLWWSLADRNAPQLARILATDVELSQTVARILETVPEALARRDSRISDQLAASVESLLGRLREGGSRQSRIDASRGLDVLAQVRGRTFEEAIELLANVPPGRTPRPVREITHLLNTELRAPRSLREPTGLQGRE